MTKNEKLSKVVQDFSMLPEEKQNYILGILQALVFASGEREEPAAAETRPKEVDEDAQRYNERRMFSSFPGFWQAASLPLHIPALWGR